MQSQYTDTRQPVLVLTQLRQASGRVAIGVPILKSLVSYDSTWEKP